MNLTESDIAILILKKLRGELSNEERTLLEDWAQYSAAHQKKYLELTDFYALQLKRKDFLEAERQSARFSLPVLKDSGVEIVQPPSRFKRRLWLVTASVITLLGVGFYFYITEKNSENVAVAELAAKDIQAPASNRAIITLADGSNVFLDSVNNGQLASIGNVKLVKLANGQVAYQSLDGQISQELQYNTLTNPKGSKVIDMRLSDGSHIWLNAGSSITYPVVFVENERKVVLEGEGYFEVAKDPSKKFIVTANGTKTEVLGTHFNINAYGDQSKTKVTLLEGTVKVSSAKSAHSPVLSPGQQAVIKAEQNDIQIQTVKLDQIVAWKNGFFTFDDLDFEEVMKKIGRWYDVKIVFSGKIPSIKLEGDLSQNTSLNGALDALRFQGANVKLSGKNVIVY